MPTDYLVSRSKHAGCSGRQGWREEPISPCSKHSPKTPLLTTGRVLFNDYRTCEEVKRDEQRNVETAIALEIDPNTI